MTRVRVFLAAAGVAVALGVYASAQNPDDFARRQYDSGLTFLQSARYAEALKDFQVVVDSFPQSAVADDALMQIGLYQLEVAHDLTAAQAAADRLLKEYPNSDSAPMAYIIGGRLTITRGRSAAEVETALASFDRVPRLFPGSDAVAAARFFSGDTLRLARRVDESLDRLRRVPMEYPRSIWAARADLATVVTLVSLDRAPQAFGRLQRIRQQYPGSVEAATALNYGTLLYRLYVRGKSQPPYTFSGRFIGAETARYSDVMGIVIDDIGPHSARPQDRRRDLRREGQPDALDRRGRAVGVLRRAADARGPRPKGGVHSRRCGIDADLGPADRPDAPSGRRDSRRRSRFRTAIGWCRTRTRKR